MFSNKYRRTRANVKLKKMEELALPNAKLKFCVDQLQNLNLIFHKRLEINNYPEKSISLAKSVTERLVQRLLCAAARIDPRFSTKYLIDNRPIYQNETSQAHLEYLIRLDKLSTPALYSNDEAIKCEILENERGCPPGYARIRLNSSSFKLWEEFVNANGFLRRDQVQARMVELLAQAVTDETLNSPLQVDEGRACGIPGKIVDAFTLHHILKTSSDRQVFYGPGGKVPRFPDTRDFRIAILDEPSGIKIKIEFMSPVLSSITVKVRLLLAIGTDLWPSTSDFPSRIPLGHLDCLLYQQAAQSGMYLVGYGVHSSAWQIRMPAAEFALLNHYGSTSTIRTILDILYEILKDINTRRKYQKPMSYKILNKYMLFTLLMEELENNSQSPFLDMFNWSPIYLSSMVLKLLDKSIWRLNSEFQSNYFFKDANVLVNPGHLCDEDFNIEASNIKNYMIRLFDESLTSHKDCDDFSTLLLFQETELKLLSKWQELVVNLLPLTASKNRKLYFTGSKITKEIAYSQYSLRQLEYIGLVLQNMLKVRQIVVGPNHYLIFDSSFQAEQEEKQDPVEDIIFILVTILDQARDQFLLPQYTSSPSNDDYTKPQLKIKQNYNDTILKFIEIIRRDKELNSLNQNDLNNDLNLVKIILKWLYKAIDLNKKYLAPILHPFLYNVFTVSYHISYHLDSIKEQLKTDELEALGSFARLINIGAITPAEGLVDSVNKNWLWAKDMLEMIEKGSVRLVFIDADGIVHRHILTLPSYIKANSNQTNPYRTLNVKSRNSKMIKRRTTLPGRNYFNSLLDDVVTSPPSDTPPHESLKITSPLTLILSKKHRRGQHRGGGDICKSMASMQKLNLLQEATAALPKNEQQEILEIIRNINGNKERKSGQKKWSSTLPHTSKVAPEDGVIQRYTPIEESAGIQTSPKQSRKLRKPVTRSESLLETSRAARLKEDNSTILFQENLKIRNLIEKSASFKF